MKCKVEVEFEFEGVNEKDLTLDQKVKLVEEVIQEGMYCVYGKANVIEVVLEE